MAEHKLKQIVYYSDGSNKNYPSNTSSALLANSINEITSTKNGIIERIGIQNYSDYPGDVYFINITGQSEIEGKRLIRPREIYEVSFKKAQVVKDFKIDETFLQEISNNINSYLIIDIIYKI